MRTEIFNTIRDTLLKLNNGEIKHVDLWNHNVEFIEQEQPWQMPAVFIEFKPITWRQLKPGNIFHTRSEIALHVVTAWTTTPDNSENSDHSDHSDHSVYSSTHLNCFRLLNDIHRAVRQCKGEHFGQVELLTSETNHNHEEIIEHIEIYQYVGQNDITDTKPPKQHTRWQLSNIVVGRTIPHTPGNNYRYLFTDGVVKFKCKSLEHYNELKQAVTNNIPLLDIAVYQEPNCNSKTGFPDWVGFCIQGERRVHVSVIAHTEAVAQMTDIVNSYNTAPIKDADTRCPDVTLDSTGHVCYTPSKTIHDGITIEKLEAYGWPQTSYVRRVCRIYDTSCPHGDQAAYYDPYKQDGEHIFEYRRTPMRPIDHNGPIHVWIHPRHSRRRWYAPSVQLHRKDIGEQGLAYRFFHWINKEDR